jgi:NADPH2:quinone reductase
MKAVVYRENGGPDVLSYEDVADLQPAAGEVLVKVEAISIEGGDLLRRRHVPPRPNPRIEGYAASGEVIALGEGVTSFQIGDKVTTFAERGSHAELRTPRAEHCWLVPEALAMNAAAVALVGLGTAGAALFELGRLERGQTVLITGATGGVGMGAIQLAHTAGARVIATGSNLASLNGLRRYGLDEPLVVNREPFAQRVKDLTDGRGVDVFIDMVGGNALQSGLDSLVGEGRAVMVGAISSLKGTIAPYSLLAQGQSLFGCILPLLMPRPSVRQMIDNILQRLADGDLTAVIDREYRLSEAQLAHTRAEERGRIGRVVMIP